jgi:hypothetical protein
VPWQKSLGSLGEDWSFEMKGGSVVNFVLGEKRMTLQVRPG